MTPRETLRLLRRYESPNVTYQDPDGTWPIVWEQARGCTVRDATGRRFLDLTAAFGVAATGHANAAVVREGRRQMGRLLHAMGDVHPHALKADLARKLSTLTFGRWARAGHTTSREGRTIFTNSGFEAVEAALKTARLATGRPGILAFEGAYHGLGYGTLNATHRDHFREPFRDQLGGFGAFIPWPGCGSSGCAGTDPESCSDLARIEKRIRAACAKRPIGAILVEPVQARGGIRIPPPGLLPLLRRLADELGALLIADEIYTGFGRTGRWFACEHSGVVPDLVCVGKALTGGFPLSACIGRSDLMEAAWPPSNGEAIHTSTFLGHPVGCAMALAQMEEIHSKGLVSRSAKLGSHLLALLRALPSPIGGLRLSARGLGLMAGLELSRADGTPAGTECVSVVKRMLQCGFILLPEGGHGEVVGFTPPLTIARVAIDRTIRALFRSITEVMR